MYTGSSKASLTIVQLQCIFLSPAILTRSETGDINMNSDHWPVHFPSPISSWSPFVFIETPSKVPCTPLYNIFLYFPPSIPHIQYIQYNGPYCWTCTSFKALSFTISIPGGGTVGEEAYKLNVASRMHTASRTGTLQRRGRQIRSSHPHRTHGRLHRTQWGSSLFFDHCYSVLMFYLCPTQPLFLLLPFIVTSWPHSLQRLDVPEVLGLLREQRMFMVQTFSQYCFVYQALIHFLRSARLVWCQHSSFGYTLLASLDAKCPFVLSVLDTHRTHWCWREVQMLILECDWNEGLMER